MPKVYVIGAKVPTGGAYMAYHIGRMISARYGYALYDVHIYDTGTPIFAYDHPMTTIPSQEMERVITPEDILVVNPSYSSFLFGLRLPGKKIMYVQDFRTFLLLDCHCDLYVSVSALVSRYVEALYGIKTPVIPAFIDTYGMPPKPWDQRPVGSALVYIKNPSREHKIVLDYVQRRLPHIDLSNVIEGRGLTHAEFLKRIGEVRYFVNMSLAEGFGLVPLEAMAMGTMVTGVDGLAGSDYMRQGENAYTSSIKNLRNLPETIAKAFSDEVLAKKYVQGGIQTAAQYSLKAFENAWLPLLHQALSTKH